MKNDGFEVSEDANISASPVLEPSLANAETDPFAKHKKDPKKFHYRALNTKSHNIRKKEAGGYQTIGGSEFGDLVLAKIPKELYEARIKANSEKADKRGKAIRDSFADKTNRFARHGLTAEE